MFKLTIFLDGFQEPIIITGVSKINHEVINGDKAITFEYQSVTGSGDNCIRKGLFFIDKITGYTI